MNLVKDAIGRLSLAHAVRKIRAGSKRGSDTHADDAQAVVQAAEVLRSFGKGADNAWRDFESATVHGE